MENGEFLELKSAMWIYLLEIAKLGGIGNFVLISTARLGKIVDKSQQSVSRHLLFLKEKGYIKKRINKKGTKIILLEKGEIELRKIFNEFNLIFSRSYKRIIKSELDETEKIKKIKWLKEYEIILKKGYNRKEFNNKFPKINDFYNSIEWKNCRIQILKRDNYTCQCCGKKPSRQVHHINDPYYCPELCLDSRNLIILCDHCHNDWHGKGN